MKKAYIAGKVSGLPIEEINDNFYNKAIKLICEGYEVFNPVHEVKQLNIERILNKLPPLTDEENRKEIMRFCICNLLLCDEIHLLPNWKDSAGAWEERTMAQKYGIDIVYPKY